MTSGMEPRDSSESVSGESGVHEYDGIVECDNQLPSWWLWLLYGMILSAAVYWFHFHTFSSGELPSNAYAREQAERKAKEAEALQNAEVVTAEGILSLSRDPNTLAIGKEAYAQSCAACHGPNGGGTIGPNLTDAFWIHGGAPDKVYGTIRNGFLPKGMPAWGTQLGEVRVRAVAAYVTSLKDTNVAGGKAAQGEKEN